MAFCKKTETYTFMFHSDSGHGWLAVKRSILEELDLLDQISTYSYQKGRTVYLEEDCDAPLLTNKIIRAGFKVKYTESKNYNILRSPIRSYGHFKKG